ncbi:MULTISPECIES: hypothetical protein [Streptosporangium]|uniref:Glycosyltransferase RgtA/B/C/D-like domain-containing protein n=1 Tax=Streptosporangium brasiliense TaxID=47480 RepID=A0ABT9RC59_9ACTN|nr:hypothetical protein [Streptosporangium brasiliense]MDP9866844.1 hypothetical protein [Streptosporangium brasiliense]
MPVAVFAVAVLGFYGVSPVDMALFGVYVAAGLAFPGVLLVRVLYRRRRTLVEELALGLALGYALEVLTYIAARAVGLPLLVLVWPVVTYAVFAAVPRLRGYWRGGVRPSTPRWWSWSLALIIGYLIAWSAVNFFRKNLLTWPALGTSYVDMPFHLALIGELKHHMPPTVPMVAGEPLLYHWFVYAHLAAASWVTGVEPLVLLFRLGVLPMLAALAVILAMIARRVTGSWAVALLALLGTVFIAAPNLYQGINVGIFTWRAAISWLSPTQTFGTLLFAPVILLLVDLLERRRSSAGCWLLLGIFLVAVTGAKATYLPLLIAGLGTVAAVELVRRRRPSWPTLAALGLTAACFVFAQTVLFRQANLGMVINDLSLFRKIWGGLTGLGERAEPSLVSVLGIALLYVLSWAIEWCGIIGLLSRPRLLMRPPVVLMLGMGTVGVGAVLFLGHPHMGQIYFFDASYPYLVIVAAYGLSVAVRRARLSPRALAYAGAAGVAAACLIRELCGVEVPLGAGQSDAVLYRPYLVLAVTALLAAGVLAVVHRRRVVVGALTITMIAAVGFPAAWCTRVLSAAFHTPAGDSTGVESAVAAPVVSDGALAAGRWLRAHSGTDDVVATNARCLGGPGDPCDSRRFWAAALTERRVLVEGWAYTATNMSRWHPGERAETLPFWDEERIRANDEIFDAPSAASVRRLRLGYGVRWLFVDERYGSSSPRIGDFANLRFRSGGYAVYELPEDVM